MFQRKFAFTLAEVLITLGIIGVVAALTIPTLIAKFEEMQRVTALKKAYSTISNAAQRMINDNGGTAKALCATMDNRCIRDKFIEYLSYTKKCSSEDEPLSLGNCFARPPTDWKNLDGSDPVIGHDASVILNDGTFIHFYQYSDDVGTRILVDINGFKKPNITGKDIFRFDLVGNKVIPSGDGTNCDGTGENCTAYYILK